MLEYVKSSKRSDDLVDVAIDPSFLRKEKNSKQKRERE